MSEYKKNIWAKILIPYIIIMWSVLAIGCIYIFLFHEPSTGFIILTVACFMMLGWWQIQKRAARHKADPEKKEPKRKNKHPAYKKTKN